ncbi:MAG TPA: glucokinase [Methylococcaceae bacterium]|nr:glucokinase [Methylococcaceae bacterium]
MKALLPLLAGDIGGTKTRLALYFIVQGELRLQRERTYPSARYDSLESILGDFLAGDDPPSAACFGVAGPVENGRCRTTNLPWLVDAAQLAATLGIPDVALLNDLEATALGLLHLPPQAFRGLQPGTDGAPGTMAVIAAGTGLGEAILYWDGFRHHALPTEGGHTDFAPNDEWEDGLLAWLRHRLGGHVSYERILSGPGLHTLYEYLREAESAPESPDLRARLEREDPAAVIAELGLSGQASLCREALRRLARIYGAEAGNLALKSLARGGVILAGGIAPKILPALTDGTFLEGFLAKGRFRTLLEQLPVRIALDPAAPLLGAAAHAAEISQRHRCHHSVT